MIKVKTLLFLGILVTIALLCGGCWDSTEIEKLAVVVGIAVDRVPESNLTVLTVQILNPAKSKGSDANAGEKSYSVLTGQGETFYDAVNNLSKSTPHRLFYSQSRIIILGKKLVESGITDITDFMERDPESRRTSWILISSHTAKEVLETNISTEEIPSSGLEMLMNMFEKKQNIVYPIQRNEFTLRLRSNAKVSFAPLVELTDEDEEISNKLHESEGVIGANSAGKPNEAGGSNGSNEKSSEASKKKPSKKVRIDKMAILKNNHWAGTISAKETIGLLWLYNRIEQDTIKVPYKSGNIILDIFRGKSTVTPHLQGKEIEMVIKGEGDATIREINNIQVDLRQPTILKEIGDVSAQFLKERMESTINIAQNELNADFVGFAHDIYNIYPDQWKLLKGNWDTKFSQIKTTVSIDLKIRKLGMINNSPSWNLRKE